MEAKCIIFLNQKGGVAKTTSTYNIAAAKAKEGKTVGVNLQRSMKLQYQHLVKNTQVESENVNTDIMAGCSYGDSMPIVESKIYASCFDMVVQKLAEFLAVRYPSDNVTTNNMCHVIQKKLHFGVHWDFKNHKIFADSIDLYSETIMSGVSWVGVDRHKMSMDILSNVMGDFSFI